MTPWSFNAYVDGVVREVNDGVLGKVAGLGKQWLACDKQCSF